MIALALTLTLIQESVVGGLLGPSAAEVKTCEAALAAVATDGNRIEQRLAILKACEPLFDGACREAWSNVYQAKPKETWGWLLGACGSVYCPSLKQLTSCKLQNETWTRFRQQITAEQGNRELRVILQAALTDRLGKSDGARLFGAFERAWRVVFPWREEPTITGELPEAVVYPILEKIRPRLSECVGNDSRVSATFDIDSEGRVVHERVPRAEFRECVVAQLKTLSFPVTKGPKRPFTSVHLGIDPPDPALTR